MEHASRKQFQRLFEPSEGFLKQFQLGLGVSDPGLQQFHGRLETSGAVLKQFHGRPGASEAVLQQFHRRLGASELVLQQIHERPETSEPVLQLFQRRLGASDLALQQFQERLAACEPVLQLFEIGPECGNRVGDQQLATKWTRSTRRRDGRRQLLVEHFVSRGAKRRDTSTSRLAWIEVAAQRSRGGVVRESWPRALHRFSLRGAQVHGESTRRSKRDSDRNVMENLSCSTPLQKRPSDGKKS